MEWMTSLGRNAALLAVLYIAAVIEVAEPPRGSFPSVIALAVTLMVYVSRFTIAVFWAALGGLIIDVLSQGRLGPLMVSCGIITCVLLSWNSSAPKAWWFAPVLSFALAAAPPIVPALIARWETVPPETTDALLTIAVQRGAATASAALGLQLMLLIAVRVWNPPSSRDPLALTNQWRMITH